MKNNITSKKSVKFQCYGNLFSNYVTKSVIYVNQAENTPVQMTHIYTETSIENPTYSQNKSINLQTFNTLQR